MATDSYEPPSSFLVHAAKGDVHFGDDAFGRTNRQKLIALTTDKDDANRDWAVLTLSNLDIDSKDVREALRLSANDTNMFVRAEALCGLAQRDRVGVVALIKVELEKPDIALATLEAAAYAGSKDLVPLLQNFYEKLEGSDTLWMENLKTALDACRNERPLEPLIDLN